MQYASELEKKQNEHEYKKLLGTDILYGNIIQVCCDLCFDGIQIMQSRDASISFSLFAAPFVNVPNTYLTQPNVISR